MKTKNKRRITIRMGAGHNDLTLATGEQWALPSREYGARTTHAQREANDKATQALGAAARAIASELHLKAPPKAKQEGKPRNGTTKHHHRRKGTGPATQDAHSSGGPTGQGHRPAAPVDAPKKPRRRRSAPRPVPASGQAD